MPASGDAFVRRALDDVAAQIINLEGLVQLLERLGSHYGAHASASVIPGEAGYILTVGGQTVGVFQDWRLAELLEEVVEQRLSLLELLEGEAGLEGAAMELVESAERLVWSLKDLSASLKGSWTGRMLIRGFKVAHRMYTALELLWARRPQSLVRNKRQRTRDPRRPKPVSASVRDVVRLFGELKTQVEDT